MIPSSDKTVQPNQFGILEKTDTIPRTEFSFSRWTYADELAASIGEN
jgi:hypothetical protein